jgi:hypothetical protein
MFIDIAIFVACVYSKSATRKEQLSKLSCGLLVFPKIRRRYSYGAQLGPFGAKSLSHWFPEWVSYNFEEIEILKDEGFAIFTEDTAAKSERVNRNFIHG